MNRTSVVNGSWNDLLLSFVSRVVIVKLVGRCVAFGIPELFSFFTTVFGALWLVRFFLGHRFLSGEFFFMLFMILFKVFFPIGVFLYQFRNSAQNCDSVWSRTSFSYYSKFSWKFPSFAHFLKTFFQYSVLFLLFSFSLLSRQIFQNETSLLQKMFGNNFSIA